MREGVAKYQLGGGRWEQRHETCQNKLKFLLSISMRIPPSTKICSFMFPPPPSLRSNPEICETGMHHERRYLIQRLLWTWKIFDPQKIIFYALIHLYYRAWERVDFGIRSKVSEQVVIYELGFSTIFSSSIRFGVILTSINGCIAPLGLQKFRPRNIHGIWSLFFACRQFFHNEIASKSGSKKNRCEELDEMWRSVARGGGFRKISDDEAVKWSLIG